MTTCSCRDTGGKRTRRAQRTSFNTLDNWGHKLGRNPIKKEKDRKERLKDHSPKHIQYTRLHEYNYNHRLLILPPPPPPPAYSAIIMQYPCVSMPPAVKPSPIKSWTYGIFNYQKLDIVPLKWPLGLLLSKAGHGIFNYQKNGHGIFKYQKLGHGTFKVAVRPSAIKSWTKDVLRAK